MEHQEQIEQERNDAISEFKNLMYMLAMMLAAVVIRTLAVYYSYTMIFVNNFNFPKVSILMTFAILLFLGNLKGSSKRKQRTDEEIKCMAASAIRSHAFLAFMVFLIFGL